MNPSAPTAGDLARLLAVTRTLSGDGERAHFDRLERANPTLAAAGRRVSAVLRQLSEESAAASEQEASAARAPDRWVGRYRLGQVLGSGEASVVHEAFTDGDSLAPVALKIVQPWIQTAKLLAAFAREQEILQSVADHSMVKVLDQGVTEDDRPWFAMELVRGDHADLFVRNARLSLCDRLRIMAQICRAVGRLHRLGVIHRDLKPSNILIEAADDPASPLSSRCAGVPRILDFGLARVIDVRNSTHVTASIGHIAGTLQYMAPEQVGLGQPITIQTDIFALGGVLFTLIAGRPPLHSRLAKAVSPDAVFRLIRDEPRPRLSATLRRGDRRDEDGLSHQDALPQELDWIVAKALDLDPRHRYRDADEFAEELERLAANRALVITAAPPRMREVWSQVRRHRVAALTAAAILLSLFAGLGVAIASAREARAAQREAEDHLASTKQVVRELTMPLDILLATAPGQTKARQELLVQSVMSLEAVASNSPADRELRLLLASLLSRAGMIFADPGAPNLGKPEPGVVALARAEQLANGLLDETPDDVELLTLVGTTRLSRARIEVGRGNGDAVKWFEAAREPFRRLLELQPDRLRERVHLVYTDRMIATFWEAQARRGDELAATADSPTDAARRRQEAEVSRANAGQAAIQAEIAYRALPPWPDSTESRRQRVDALQTVAEAAVLASMPEKAMPLLDDAAELAARLAREAPDQPGPAILLATNRRYAAELAAKRGHFDDACELMREAIPEFEHALALDPAPISRIDCTVTPWGRLAEFEERAGRVDECLHAGERHIDAARSAFAIDADEDRGFASLWDALIQQSERIERAIATASPGDTSAQLAQRAVTLIDEALALAPRNMARAPDATETKIATLEERRARMLSVID